MEVVGEQPAVAVALTDLPGEVLRPDALVEGDPGHNLDADTVRRVWAAVRVDVGGDEGGVPVGLGPVSAVGGRGGVAGVAGLCDGGGGVSDRPRRRI